MEYLTLNSFLTKRSVTIDSLKTHFLPIQEGEGNPSPENVRPITGWNSIKIRKTGKNLAKIVGYSASANNSSTDLRRLTNNYGTTISTTEYVSGNDKLVITQTVQPDDYVMNSYRHGYVVIILDGLPYGKKYNFSFKVSDIVSNPLNATLNQITECSLENTHYDPIVTEDNHVIFKNQRFTRHSTIPNRCGIEIRNCGMSFTLSEFMITAVEDEDFTYEPYREEEVEVELEANLTHGSNLASYNDYWYSETGVSAYRFCDLIDGPALPVDFIFTDKDPSLTLSGVYFGVIYNKSHADDGYNWIIYNGQLKGRNTNSQDYPSTGAGRPCKYMFCYPASEDTLTAILQKYNVTIVPSTFYGGYVDIAKGEIVQDYYKYTVTGNENFSASGSWVTIYLPRSFDISAIALYPGVGICTHYPYAPYKRGNIGVMYNERALTFDGQIRDASGWKAFCKDQYDNGIPVEVCYKLKEPKAYPLPPETLKTLRGFNTIFSTGNDTIEVGYSEMSPTSLLKRRRDIIASEPHLVTVETGNTEDSDVIASFKANATLPIKSMIVNFEPIQEGEGDPSPDNIRPITGLSELEIHNFPHLVQWNQWLQPLTEEHWRAYNTSNNTVTFSEDGVATDEWLNTNGGYSSSIRNKVGTLQSEGQVWYVSYMVRHHGQDTKRFGVECCGSRQFRSVVEAEPENWYQVSVVTTYNKGTRNYVYIANISDVAQVEVGLTADVKAPIHINLTQMYGAGNEPTKEEFEAQCVLNGIDLTTYNPYDEGTVMPWRTSENEDRVYQIQLPENDCDLCAESGRLIYNNTLELVDGVYRNLVTDTRETLDIYVQTWSTGRSFSQNIVTMQSVDIGHLSITFSIDDPIARYIALTHNGKTRNIPLLLAIPYTKGEYTVSFDILSNNPTTVGGYQFTNVKLQYNDDPYSKKFYGGYIDIVNGEYVKTWRTITLLPSIKLYYGSGYGYTFCFPFSNSMYQQQQTHGPRTYDLGSSYAVSGTGGLCVGKKFIENILGIEYTEAALQQYLQDQLDNGTPLQLTYPLKNPVHYQLDPVTVKTLKGTNNIYTNANGKSIIKYWTH